MASSGKLLHVAPTLSLANVGANLPRLNTRWAMNATARAWQAYANAWRFLPRSNIGHGDNNHSAEEKSANLSAPALSIPPSPERKRGRGRGSNNIDVRGYFKGLHRRANHGRNGNPKHKPTAVKKSNVRKLPETMGRPNRRSGGKIISRSMRRRNDLKLH